MSTPSTTPPRPSLLTMVAATIAGPLHVVVMVIIALVLIGLGVLKFLPPGTVEVPISNSATGSPTVDLLTLATGGVITTPWGPWLIGALQVLLGLGLLIRPARPLAGLGCLLMLVVVLVGFFAHLGSLTSNNGLNQTGVALLMLAVVLLAGAATGTRAAARRLGVAS